MPQSKGGYGQTLAALRNQAEAAPGGPVPWWNFFNAMPYDGGHSDPTEAMLRWQAMTSLAYGSSGVMYFCYWSNHADAGHSKLGGGLIVPRGPADNPLYGRGPHWYEAQVRSIVYLLWNCWLLIPNTTNLSDCLLPVEL